MASAQPEADDLGGGLVGRATDLGEFVYNVFVETGALALFFARTLRWMVASAPRRETLVPNAYQIGVLSLPVVALTGAFIGMVLAVQTYAQFRQLNLESRLGAVINVTLVKELGPVLAATMLAGRVGSAMAAELGTMRVTEQIDALTSLGADPIQHLVVPRFIASIVLIPALTIVADLMGVMGAYFFSVVVLDIDLGHYWQNSEKFVGSFDVFSGIVKSLFFGGAIAVISCHRGFNCGPGAEGVGAAATKAFVLSFGVILALDLCLGIIIDAIYFAFWPEGTSLV